MRTRILALVAAVVAQWFHGALHAGELPDYMRFREDANGARLEIAIRSFSMPSGQRVDLMGVAHIADDAYYQELNRRFDAYDSVLFELVGDPDIRKREPPGVAVGAWLLLFTKGRCP